MKKPINEVVENKSKRGKKSVKWNLALECLAKAKKADKQLVEPKTKHIKKESVMKVKIDKKALKSEKEALKAELNLEKEAIKTVVKNCKIHAKELAKIVDDEAKQKLIAKLIKIGYSFDVSDPTKLVVSVNVGCTIVPKMKKLKNGAKAVAADVEETPEAETQPVVEETPEVQPPAEAAVEEEPAPTEVPIGDTFTDTPETEVSEPTDEELNEIEDEESSEDADSDIDELANYREEFYKNLDEEGDDSNL